MRVPSVHPSPTLSHLPHTLVAFVLKRKLAVTGVGSSSGSGSPSLFGFDFSGLFSPSLLGFDFSGLFAPLAAAASSSGFGLSLCALFSALTFGFFSGLH